VGPDEAPVDPDNYNPVIIDRLIRKKLGQLALKVPELQLKIRSYQDRLKDTSKLSPIGVKEIKRDIAEAAEQIRNIVEKKYYLEYVRQSQPILDAYKKLRPEVKDIMDEDADGDRHVRSQLINAYIGVAEQYIPFRPPREEDRSLLCSSCGNDLETNSYLAHGIYVCRVCGCEQEDEKFKEAHGVDSTVRAKGYYRDRQNFQRALDRYQCKVHAELPESLFDKLDRYFEQTHTPTSSQALALELLPDGTKFGTSIAKLITALGRCKESIYYKYIHLIAHQYWGWKPDDLTQHQDKIMECYDLTQPLYLEYRDPQKVSSMNTQYRLCWLLWQVGCERSPERFKILRTPDIIKDYERIRRKICKRLGWEFVSLQEMAYRLRGDNFAP